MRRAVVITGTNGGIGAALKKIFSDNNYAVIGVGKSPDAQLCDEYIQADFSAIIHSASIRQAFCIEVAEIIRRYELRALVNNSATQILAPLDKLTFDEFQETLGINVSMPFLLSKICFRSLCESSGSIVNIGSIHAKLTKKEFVAYATSKGALEALTKALAVDVGDKIRVNLIAPAAIETDMLLEGFSGNSAGYNRLKDYHPVGSIGSPAEVAKVALLLAGESMPFVNGSIFDISGGISSCLSDPATESFR